MNLPLLAIRNLVRNGKRTILIISAIACVISLTIVWGSLSGGLSTTLERMVTELELGEWQIHAPEYRKTKDGYLTVSDQVFRQVKKITDQDSKYHVSGRLYTSALGSFGKNSTHLLIKAVHPPNEIQTTQIASHLKEGEFLKETSHKKVLIGSNLSKNLNIHTGDELLIFGSGYKGSVVNDIAIVKGVLASINPVFDRNGVIMLESDFRELFELETGYHELSLTFGNLPKNQIPFTELKAASQEFDLLHWSEIRPILNQTLFYLKIAAMFTYFTAYIALGGLLLNIFLLSVYDRISEYGVLRAVGMRPISLWVLVEIESLILAIVSSLIALLVGGGVSYVISNVGIDLGTFVEQISISGVTLRPVLGANLGIEYLAPPLVFAWIAIPLVAAYPAFKAATVPVLEAINSK